MGVKSFFLEVKAKVSPTRLFKALVTESTEVLAKFKPDAFKKIEVVGGGPVTVGSIIHTDFPDGAPFKYVRYKVDVLDTDNLVCKYTLYEGDVLGDKFEKIVYEMKYEASEDGGCVLKQTSEYHTKGDAEITDEEIEAGKQQNLGLYNACAEYLLANPHVCA